MRKFELTGASIVAVWTLVLVCLWGVGTEYSVPTPWGILQAWVQLVTEGGLLYEVLFVSCRLNLEVLALSTLISVGLAYLTVSRFWGVPAHVLAALRFTGVTGLMIVFNRVFGGGHLLKVSVLTFTISTFFTSSMIDVVQSVGRQEYDHTRTLRMGAVRGAWEVVVRGRLDQTFDVLRQNAAVGWMSLTMVEGLVRFEGGVGVLMLNEIKYRNLNPIFAMLITVGVIGLLQDALIVKVKHWCCPHVKFARGVK